MNEWHNFGESWQAFRHAGLAQPGTMIEIEGELLLIGNINCYGGTCDDCMAFRHKAIVDRYTRVLGAS